MKPPASTAANLSPASLVVIEYQLRAPEVVRSVHVAPESEEVYMYPPQLTAASFIPSALDATENQRREPASVRSAQLTPESIE